MVDELTNNSVVSKETIIDYEFLYNTKIKTMELYLSAAMDITKSQILSNNDTNIQRRIKILLNTLKKDYNYDYYIDLCARYALGESIVETDLPITEAIYIINKDEVLDLYNKSGIIEGIYHDIAGNVIDIDIDNNKVFGGIEINGGTVNVYGDVKIPYMRCKNGTIVANDVTLYADKLDLTNDYESHGKVCFDGNGILKSKKDIDISQIDVMCNGGTLQSDKSIVLHEFRAYGGGVYIANCNLISETGIDAGYGYRDFFNILDNVNVYGNVIGGSLQIVNDVIVDGSFIGSLCVSKDGDITANSFELGDFWNYGGRLYSKGDLLYSGEYRIDDEQSLIIVEGNMRVNVLKMVI